MLSLPIRRILICWEWMTGWQEMFSLTEKPKTRWVICVCDGRLSSVEKRGSQLLLLFASCCRYNTYYYYCYSALLSSTTSAIIAQPRKLRWTVDRGGQRRFLSYRSANITIETRRAKICSIYLIFWRRTDFATTWLKSLKRRSRQ